jgi:hypothetical protein
MNVGAPEQKLWTVKGGAGDRSRRSGRFGSERCCYAVASAIKIVGSTSEHRQRGDIPKISRQRQHSWLTSLDFTSLLVRLDSFYQAISTSHNINPEV